MVRSAFPTPLITALAWIDRWVNEAGRNCCAGRSQAALRASVSLESDPATADRSGRPAPDPASRPPRD